MRKITNTKRLIQSSIFIMGIVFPQHFHAQTGTQNPANQSITITESFNGFTDFKVNGNWKFQDPNTLQMFNIATDRISVKFKPNAAQSQISAFENTSGLIRKKRTVIDWYRYDLSNAQGSFFDIARMCASNALVEKVSISSANIYMQTSNDPVSSNAWYYNNANDKDIDMHEAWNIETGLGSQILVAIIDSGIDWAHEDLGMGTDGYQNIYLNPGEDAWTDPNNPATGNGIDDDNNGYVDDWKGWNFYNQNNDTRLNAGHGTHTAGIVSAKTNNNKGVAGVAGGWGGSGCKIIPCGAGPNGQSMVEEAIDGILYAVPLGAKVINMSFGGAATPEFEDAIVYAYEQGVAIVASAGNDGIQPVVYPANHPLVIGVGATEYADLRRPNSNYGQHLDMSAPGLEIISTQENNNYGSSSGTSFSSPMVAGVAALMLSQNPCLGPRQIQDMLTATSEKVGGYYYNYNPLIPGKSNELGYGRLNAHDAVKAAQESAGLGIDLYIRDRFNDTGNDAGYVFTWDYDESPDIWVRNNPDGFIVENQVHEAQSFELNPNDPFYVYVRVGNKGCTPSLGTETLSLYRSIASTLSGWPVDWDGILNPNGAVIGTQTIPALQPGESVILEFEWAPNYNIGHCLLARIENSVQDPITVYPDNMADDIYRNNNIAMRNVFIHDIYPGVQKPVIGGVVYPYGDFVAVGNRSTSRVEYDFIFKAPDDEPGNPLTKEAEVILIFDNIGWNLFYPYMKDRTDILILRDNRVQLLNREVRINQVPFDPQQRVSIYVSYSFLTQEVTSKSTFGYHVIQKYSDNDPQKPERWTGAVHYYITKYERDPFKAIAGEDKYVREGEIVTVNASTIQEDAVYNWYDETGVLIYSGSSFTATPEISKKYKLEVIADADGFKDYDSMEIKVSSFYLNELTPNPVNDQLTVNYHVTNAQQAFLMIVGSSNNYQSSNYVLNTQQSQRTIDVSQLATGHYQVILICNGQVVDTEALVVN